MALMLIGWVHIGHPIKNVQTTAGLCRRKSKKMLKDKVGGIKK